MLELAGEDGLENFSRAPQSTCCISIAKFFSWKARPIQACKSNQIINWVAQYLHEKFVLSVS